MEPHIDWERFIDERIQAGSRDLLRESMRMAGYVLARRLMDKFGDEDQVARNLGLSVDRVRRMLRNPGAGGD